MKKWVLAGAVAGLALALSGCGVDVPSADDLIDKAESAAASAAASVAAEATEGAVVPGGDDAGDGAGDPSAAICAKDGTAGTQALAIELQLLAQPNLDTILSVRSGESALTGLLDTAGASQGIEDYRVLEGHPAAGFKDPKEVLDMWDDLNSRMDTFLHGSAEPTQADIDDYTAAMGDPQALIMSQLDVAMARDQYCS